MFRKPFLVIMLTVLALTACVPASPAAAPATQPASTAAPIPEPDVVVVAINPQFSNAPFFIAIEEGYFAAQNIVIQVESVERSADAIRPAQAV